MCSVSGDEDAKRTEGSLELECRVRTYSKNARDASGLSFGRTKDVLSVRRWGRAALASVRSDLIFLRSRRHACLGDAAGETASLRARSASRSPILHALLHLDATARTEFKFAAGSTPDRIEWKDSGAKTTIEIERAGAERGHSSRHDTVRMVPSKGATARSRDKCGWEADGPEIGDLIMICRPGGG